MPGSPAPNYVSGRAPPVRLVWSHDGMLPLAPTAMPEANTAPPTVYKSEIGNPSPKLENLGDALPIQGDVMADLTREEIDTKLALSAAQTDVKFAQLIGKIETSTADLKGAMGGIETHLTSVEKATSGVKATIIVSVLAGIAIVIGILAFGQQWFGIGITTRDIIRATVTEERIQHPPASQQ